MTPTAIPEMLNIPNVADDAVARSRATGVLVMSGFGGVWAAWGLARSGAPGWAWFALATLVLAFGVRALGLLRGHAPADECLPPELAAQRRRAGRIFAWTSAGEGLGIFLAVNVAVNVGHPEWQAAAAMAVVGLHFLPLAFAFGYRPHLVTGAALTAWALAYPWLCAAGPIAPAGLLGAGTILFASAAWALRSAR